MNVRNRNFNDFFLILCYLLYDENDFLTAEMSVLFRHCVKWCVDDLYGRRLFSNSGLVLFSGGLEGPDELLDQPNHNNPWRDGFHSSEY